MMQSSSRVGVRALAEHLGVSTQTVRAWRLAGRIPSLGRGQYDVAEVDQVLARHGRPVSMVRERGCADE